MRAVVALAVLLSLAGPPAALPSPATAPADLEPVGHRDAAYLDAVRRRGLQTDIDYLRPEVAFDPWAYAGGRRPEPPRQMDPDTARLVWGGVFALLLAAVIAFAAWFGGRIPVSFRAHDERRRPAEPASPAPGVPAPLPDDAFVERVRAMTDRREALILMTARALERAAAANGQRIARAQTARDVLSALPRGGPQIDALRRLVREAELVHFGGRDLPEDRWRECLGIGMSLLAPGRPA